MVGKTYNPILTSRRYWENPKWLQLIQKVLLYKGWLSKLNKLTQAKIQTVLLQQRIHLSCVINQIKGVVNVYIINHAKFNRPNKHLKKIKKRELLIRQWVLQKIQILTILLSYFSLGSIKGKWQVMEVYCFTI